MPLYLGGGGFDPSAPFGTYFEAEAGYYCAQITDGGVLYALFVPPKALGQSPSNLQWKTSNTSTSGTASLTNGFANSEAMNDASHPAAQYCRGLSIGGKADFYLPAKDELNQLAINMAPGSTAATLFQTGQSEAFDTSIYYWSSTESNAYQAWGQNFSDGFQIGDFKISNLLVRGVRRLAI